MAWWDSQKDLRGQGSPSPLVKEGLWEQVGVSKIRVVATASHGGGACGPQQCVNRHLLGTRVLRSACRGPAKNFTIVIVGTGLLHLLWSPQRPRSS